VRCVCGVCVIICDVYWYSIQSPLLRSGYASLGRVCTLRSVRTLRGCLEGLCMCVRVCVCACVRVFVSACGVTLCVHV